MNPGIIKGQTPPFYELRPRDFEKLCRDLLQQRYGLRSTNLYGVSGQSQHGIDIIAQSDNGLIDVAQCKCKKTFSVADIKATSQEFLRHYEDVWKPRSVRRFFVLIACDNDSTDFQDEVLRQNGLFENIGLHYELWTASRIRGELASYPMLVATYLHPSDHWIRELCGPYAASQTRVQHNLRVPRCRFFVGREESLAQLHNLLCPSEDPTIESCLIVALQGMAGVGKSELADQYARKYLASYPGGVWWAAAENRPLESLAQLATDLGLSTDPQLDLNARVGLVLQRLQGHGRCLLILDNITDLSVVAGHLPAAPCSTIITTRLSRIDGPISRVAVDVLSNSDSCKLLTAITQEGGLRIEPGGAQRLSTELDGLPLAIELSARYLIRHPECTSFALADRIRQSAGLTDSSLVVANNRHTMSRADKAVKESIGLSVVSLGQKSLAIKLLSLVSLFDPDKIRQRDILDTLPMSCDDDSSVISEALATLVDYSLLKQESIGTFRMHRLVHRYGYDLRYTSWRDWSEVEDAFLNSAFRHWGNLHMLSLFIKCRNATTDVNAWITDSMTLPLAKRNSVLYEMRVKLITGMIDWQWLAHWPAEVEPKFVNHRSVIGKVTESQWQFLAEHIAASSAPDSSYLSGAAIPDYSTGLKTVNPAAIIRKYLESPLPPTSPRGDCFLPSDAFTSPFLSEIEASCEKLDQLSLTNILEQYLNDSRELVRTKAVLLFRYCRNEGTVDRLLDAIERLPHDEYMSIATLYVIGRLGITGSSRKLINRLLPSAPRPTDSWAFGFVYALGQLKESEGLELLKRIVGIRADQRGVSFDYAEWILKKTVGEG